MEGLESRGFVERAGCGMEIIRRLGAGIFVVRTADLKLIYVNRRFEEMFGYDPGELNGVDVATLNAPGSNSSPQEIAERIAAALRRDSLWSGEIENIRKDGSRFWSEATITATQLSEQGVAWVGVSQDVTEQKQAQGALQRKTIAIQEMLTAIESEKEKIGRAMVSNVERIIMPIIHELEVGLSQTQQKTVDLLKKSLEEIISPFAKRLEGAFPSLTPTEIRMCNLIRRGLSTKEIARLEHVCPSTVNKHRENIRRKLGITGKRINLATHLEALVNDRGKG